MELEDENVIGEGDIIFKFSSKENKNRFIGILQNMVRKNEEIVSGKYVCGFCAAYPCFRRREKNDSAGLCFQRIRQCRQEC
jgi:hypothetical protein